MTVLKHPVVVIAGPTASGKSGLALDLAEALNGVVINADSMQIYQDTPIISAVPSAADKARVPHRLYEIFPADVNGSVVDWLNLAAAESAAPGWRRSCRWWRAVPVCIWTI